MQKLRWSERGWSRGFSYCSWKFQSGSGVGATTENRWKALGFALVNIARLEIAGAGPMDFVLRRQSGSLAAPGQTDVDATFEQPRRITVAQRVRRDSPLDPRRAGGVLEGAAQHLLIGRRAGTIGE